MHVLSLERDCLFTKQNKHTADYGAKIEAMEAK